MILMDYLIDQEWVSEDQVRSRAEISRISYTEWYEETHNSCLFGWTVG